MTTLNNVDKIEVSPTCQASWPCWHGSIVTLKDGRTYSGLDSFEICSIVSNLPNARINPDPDWNPAGNWDTDAVKQHFRRYSQSNPDMGWFSEAPEKVLNRIFPSPQAGVER
ncbi:MAG: hypothetical protein JSS09_01670 [Verrucomicrobia bacterium]|nr:hypothetical protein [Verrucomicrobiota bacterium]